MTGQPPAEPGGQEQWRWDGERWQYEEAPEPTSDGPPAGEDGPWVWDGSRWRPAAG